MGGLLSGLVFSINIVVGEMGLCVWGYVVRDDTSYAAWGGE